jgi:hypothetical protein
MIDYSIETNTITDNDQVIGINPTIQEKGFNQSFDYFHLILRVKSLRVLYGLQDPKNNKPFVQTYSNTVNECRPNIHKGWSKDKDPEYSAIEYNKTLYSLIITEGSLYIRSKEYDEDISGYVYGPDHLVFTVPADIKGKIKKVNFLMAVGYTLITDPENIDRYISAETMINSPAVIQEAEFMKCSEGVPS